MVPQAAAYHAAAEGNYVGRTHSLHRTTPLGSGPTGLE